MSGWFGALILGLGFVAASQVAAEGHGASRYATDRTLHVDGSRPEADDTNPGTAQRPLRTINAAAAMAQPGDRVLVHAGVYREWVQPVHSGTPAKPIVYEAVPMNGVFVRGSELWTPSWHEHAEAPGVFVAELDPAMFAGLPYPPYEALANRRKRYPHRFPIDEQHWRARPLEFTTRTATEAVASGDPNASLFLVEGESAEAWPRTMGQVFFDGRPLTQVESPSDLVNRPGTWIVSADGRSLLLRPPMYVTHPSDGRIELSVRHRVFGSKARGLGHIVVRGFVFEHAANHAPWPQAGMVSTRSGHHYTFESNIIRFARAVGLDIGREWKDPSVERAGDTGGFDGDDATRGGHRIIGNHIHDNGSAGILGWGGNPGTVIARNVIERNNAFGTSTVEEGGIKIHGSRGMLISQNLVRDNDAAGIWLDTGYSGSRVTRNVVLGNEVGIFLELGHGRAIIDHNICAYNRDGIYSHDASDLLIAHNLLAMNAHFGVYTRQVSDRSYANPDYGADPTAPQRRDAASANHRILNNLFVDNYRGAICMGWPGPTTGGSEVDGNAFSTGRQWQWNGFEAGPMFSLDANEGRTGPHLIEATFLRALDAPSDLSPCLEQALRDRVDARLLSLEEWRSETGWDANSVVIDIRKAPSLNRQRPLFELKLQDRALLEAGCEPLPDLEGDYFGNELDPNVLLPGPFQRVLVGDTPEELANKRAKVNRWLLWPPPLEISTD